MYKYRWGVYLEMILELMHKRRSIRRFKPEPLLKETLLKIIEAAITAPSAGNKQPWRFLIIRDKIIIESPQITDIQDTNEAGNMIQDETMKCGGIRLQLK